MLTPVEPAIDESGLRRNNTLSKLEKAYNYVEIDYAFSTVNNASENFFEIQPNANQTIAFKTFLRATENLSQ